MPEAFNFFHTLSQCKQSKQLEKMLLFYLAPVLKKAKPAELVVLKKDCFLANWQQRGVKITKELGLCCKELACSDDKIYLLFYDEKMLSAHLAKKGCQNILRQSLYDTAGCLQKLLKQLAEKMNFCLCPHEIGIFLGYPPHDVQAFIKFKGKNFCLCRHWKVYCEPEKSRIKFAQIDKAREHAAVLLNRNMPFKNTVRLMKSI